MANVVSDIETLFLPSFLNLTHVDTLLLGCNVYPGSFTHVLSCNVRGSVENFTVLCGLVDI